MTSPNRSAARAAVLSALDQLRLEFPLEARLDQCAGAIRAAYGAVLDSWRCGTVPRLDRIDSGSRRELVRLDAIVEEGAAIGCYPFTTRETGIRAGWPAARVSAMCAIDALAVARLVASTTGIESTCHVCRSPLTIRVEADGALDHDQVERARVVWLESGVRSSRCSNGLCRDIRFLCPACRAPETAQLFTLPQAAAIANAFFAFQRRLPSGPGAAQ